MRDYLNAILIFIGAESLTDEEFDAITLESTEDQIEVYGTVLSVLEARESVSDLIFRLQNYFLAKGIPVVDSTQIPISNIFAGASLDDDD